MSQASFDELLQVSVYQSMSTLLGQDAWKALVFYFDLKKVADFPELFEGVLNRVFGKTRSQQIQKLIIESLLGRVGAPRVRIVEGKGLDDFYASAGAPVNVGFIDWLRRAKSQFASSIGLSR